MSKVSTVNNVSVEHRALILIVEIPGLIFKNQYFTPIHEAFLPDLGDFFPPVVEIFSFAVLDGDEHIKEFLG